eukprot:1416643-Ditylum_brightwellii.AAC.1
MENSGYYHIHTRSPNPIKDIASKEVILQSKNVTLFFDRDVKVLPYSCKKPSSQKDIASKKEILQSKN